MATFCKGRFVSQSSSTHEWSTPYEDTSQNLIKPLTVIGKAFLSQSAKVHAFESKRKHLKYSNVAQAGRPKLDILVQTIRPPSIGQEIQVLRNTPKRSYIVLYYIVFYIYIYMLYVLLYIYIYYMDLHSCSHVCHVSMSFRKSLFHAKWDRVVEYSIVPRMT